MNATDFLGLAGIIITSIVGPFILAKQKSNDKKANQSADIHVSNAQALSAIVGAVEVLHTKVDTIKDEPCHGAAKTSETLGVILHQIQQDIAVIKDRSSR